MVKYKGFREPGELTFRHRMRMSVQAINNMHTATG